VSGRCLWSVLGWVALGLVAAGCGRPGQLTGTPPMAPRDTFTYEPIRVPRARPKRSPARASRLQVPSPSVPRLPEHDPAWEIHVPARPWRYIVIHHSATDRGSAASFDHWHRHHNGWDELGYHFVIGNGTGSPDGAVEVGSRWPKQKHGAHCKVGDDETYNEFGIGICLVGNFEKHRPTEAQMASLARLVDYLRVRFHISDDHIFGHGDVDDTRCPGRYFPWDDLWRRLRAREAARRTVARR